MMGTAAGSASPWPETYVVEETSAVLPAASVLVMVVVAAMVPSPWSCTKMLTAYVLVSYV